jgi:hypothetical protein
LVSEISEKSFVEARGLSWDSLRTEDITYIIPANHTDYATPAKKITLFEV